MGEEFVGLALFGGIAASALAVAVGIWIRPNKQVGGWMMAGSTVLSVLGMAFLIAISFFGRSRSYFEEPSFWEELQFAIVIGLLMMAVLSFAIGYLLDRLRRKNEG